MNRGSCAWALSFVVGLGIFVGFYGCGGDDENNAAPDADGGGSDGTTNGDGATSGDGGGSDGTASEGGASDTGVDTGPTVDPCIPQVPTVPALKIVDVSTTTFTSAVFAAQPPGSDDWYVVEQGGRIRIVRNGTVLATPFLDISAAMGSNLGERGLLSIAFHPSYATNGRFFVMGTPAEGADGSYSATDQDAVVEFKRDPANADVAVATKVRDIVVMPASASNHNGGTIKFGPDHMLYVGTGDGGGSCESSQPGAVQDTTKLFGKILRLDVDANAPFGAAGNPFNDDARVYHYGLRNPFRFNFDEPTGDLYIGDVGQNAEEEISVAVGNVAGKNFGWPAYEGDLQGTCGAKSIGGPSPYTPPIAVADRRGTSTSPFSDFTSIIGGRVYRGAAITALKGAYVFSDFTGGEVGVLRYCNGQVYGPVSVAKSQITTNTGTLTNVSSITAGHDGEVYFTYGYGGSSRLGKLAPK